MLSKKINYTEYCDLIDNDVLINKASITESGFEKCVQLNLVKEQIDVNTKVKNVV